MRGCISIKKKVRRQQKIKNSRNTPCTKIVSVLVEMPIFIYMYQLENQTLCPPWEDGESTIFITFNTNSAEFFNERRRRTGSRRQHC